MEEIKILELFGGIGAIRKAFERQKIPHKVIDYVEIDKYAVASYNAMFNENFEVQDITTWDKDIDVDFIMHGSPCQDFSLAGLQAGGDYGSGTRSSLMYETIRIVNKLKPKYVIWENVKNLLSNKHKHNFDNYINIMHEGGYNSYYKVLNAKDYGIPQNRQRVYTISIRQDIDKGFVFPEKEELKLKLKDLLEQEVDEKYYLSDKMLNCFMSNGTGKYPRKERFLQNINKENKEIANTIITTEGNKPTCNFIKDTRNMKEKLCDYLLENNLVKENDVIRHSYSNNRMNNFYTQNSKNNNTSPTLDTRCDCLGVAIKNNTKKGYLISQEGDAIDLQQPNSTTRRGRVQKEQSQTITTQGNIGVVVNDLRIRKLTPKECWRLMGFDDIDFKKAEKVNSNTQLYKQAGNSIVVNVLEKILINLLKGSKDEI